MSFKKIIFCFRHANPSHYHHDARLLTRVEHGYSVESMPKMELVLTVTFFAIYGVARGYSSLGDWKDIFVTQLIIIIKPEVSTFLMIVINFRSYVCEVVIYNHILSHLQSHSFTCYIHIPISWWPAGRVRVFAHYIISVSSLYRLVWRYWSPKVVVRHMMSNVCLRLSQPSQLSFVQYNRAVCLQLTQFSLMMIVRMCPHLIIIFKREVWIINHCLRLGHETMARVVVLTMFLQVSCCNSNIHKMYTLQHNLFINTFRATVYVQLTLLWTDVVRINVLCGNKVLLKAVDKSVFAPLCGLWSTDHILSDINSLRPKQNRRHFVDDVFKCNFLNANVWIPIIFHWSLFLNVQWTIFQHWFW